MMRWRLRIKTIEEAYMEISAEGGERMNMGEKVHEVVIEPLELPIRKRETEREVEDEPTAKPVPVEPRE